MKLTANTIALLKLNDQKQHETSLHPKRSELCRAVRFLCFFLLVNQSSQTTRNTQGQFLVRYKIENTLSCDTIYGGG